SLMGMWCYPMPIKLKFYYTPRTKFLGFLVKKSLFIVLGVTCFVSLIAMWRDPIAIKLIFQSTL
ncbi:hypothetical protein, partial [Bacillus pseudomycoides]|uniref:hypothetical protein n=1 Tax=Bacillus pseudomycoides TaxID=64104 RepID=UPI001C54CEA8